VSHGLAWLMASSQALHITNLDIDRVRANVCFGSGNSTTPSNAHGPLRAA
jgi:hypothetical protein